MTPEEITYQELVRRLQSESKSITKEEWAKLQEKLRAKNDANTDEINW